MRFTLFNACAIRAIRDLTGNNHWAPDAIVEEIQESNGLPVERIQELGRHAPVKVWADRTNVSADEDGAVISDGRETKRLRKHERVTITYATRGGAGSHMETVEAGKLAGLMHKHRLGHVITRTDSAPSYSGPGNSGLSVCHHPDCGGGYYLPHEH